MTSSASAAAQSLPSHPNPYTDDAPLRVRDHPWQENRVTVMIAAVVALAPLIWVLGRLIAQASPVVTDEVLLALLIGVPLGAVIALFPLLLASGARLTLGSTTLTRKLRSGRGPTKTIQLADIRAGIFASRVRYRRETGKELVLFLADSEILWIADGIQGGDVEKVANALAAYGIREYAEPITNQQLAALVRKARRADGTGKAS